MRFAFGRNWESFSRVALDPQRIKQARGAFLELMDGIDLCDKRFIDIGFGQGLSLLAAMEAGAQVLGIDIDEDNREALRMTGQAMGCTRSPEVRMVSILDRSFVDNNRHMFDVVHSWGVLHHTGDMKLAIENACALVAPDGYFICSIYNRHWSSPLWKAVKWLYNKFPPAFQRLMVNLLYPIIYAAKWVVTRENPKKKERGMDFFHDVVDWVGGYPYEYADEKEINHMVCSFGFKCLQVKSAQVPTGCNEFVFRKK